MSAAAPPEARPSSALAVQDSLRRTLRLAGVQLSLNLKAVLREPQALFFLVAFPVLFLIVFGAVFTFDVDEATGVQGRQYVAAGILASAMFGTSFMNLAISIVSQREDGWLKRLGGSPLPKMSYFIAQIGAAFVITVAQTIVMVALGVAAFGFQTPDAGQWLTLLWVLLMGVASGCAMGIAVTRIIPSVRAAPAVVNLPYILLQFFSGVFFPFHSLPDVLQYIASVFPLRWLAQGLRSVFLPDEFKYVEVAQGWDLHWVAAALAIWIVVGLALAVRTFQWDRSG